MFCRTELDVETAVDKGVADMVIDYLFDDIMKAISVFYLEQDAEKKLRAYSVNCVRCI